MLALNLEVGPGGVGSFKMISVFITVPLVGDAAFKWWVTQRAWPKRREI
jgi:hypothetical protein